MEQISDLEALRAEVKGLMGLGFVQANGALEMRGVEVDHTFYAPTERRQLPPLAVVEPERAHSIQTPQPERLDSSLSDITQLKREQAELRDEVVRLKATVEDLSDRISRITSELGMS